MKTIESSNVLIYYHNLLHLEQALWMVNFFPSMIFCLFSSFTMTLFGFIPTRFSRFTISSLILLVTPIWEVWAIKMGLPFLPLFLFLPFFFLLSLFLLLLLLLSLFSLLLSFYFVFLSPLTYSLYKFSCFDNNQQSILSYQLPLWQKCQR